LYLSDIPRHRRTIYSDPEALKPCQEIPQILSINLKAFLIELLQHVEAFDQGVSEPRPYLVKEDPNLVAEVHFMGHMSKMFGLKYFHSIFFNATMRLNGIAKVEHVPLPLFDKDSSSGFQKRHHRL